MAALKDEVKHTTEHIRVISKVLYDQGFITLEGWKSCKQTIGVLEKARIDRNAAQMSFYELLRGL